jgi:signal transduction histidine kinase/CheY-like chemotaxis protein
MKSDMAFPLENAGWPALLVDSSSLTVCRANQAANQVFGAAFEGTAPHLSSLWSPENNANADQFLLQWERAPTPTAVLKFRGRGGHTRAFLTSICAFGGEARKYVLFQLLSESASGDPASGGSAQKQKLECALQLARTVALDFNNALTSILGHTSLLLSLMEQNHPWRQSLLEVEKSAAKAAEIANDLGAFSRQEKEARTQTAGNLNVLLQRIVEFFQQNGNGVPVEWKLLFERRLFSAKFDEAKIQQAFMRILENAVQALNQSGCITIQTRNVELAEPAQDRNVQLAPGAFVAVEVTDNGQGISPEVLPRIFEPFFTTKGKAHRGLGLAWVYGIVTNHGGGVAVSSQPGSGTSVRVYLPAEKRIVRDAHLDVSDLAGNATILLVDDEEIILTMGQTILSTFGYRVMAANAGQKALDILSTKERIDLVITDLVMPAMSGRELVEHIQRVSPGTRILCTSGYVWPAGQVDESAYLQKPFTSQELLRKVRQMLER